MSADKQKGEVIRVLVVEDNPDDLALFREYLLSVESVRVSRWVIRSAETLQSALDSLKEQDVDAVILDLTLPDSSGLNTYLKISEQVPACPIIVLSGMEDESLAIDLVKRGAQDYLPKSNLNPDLIVRAILHAIERQSLLQKLAEVNTALMHERNEVTQLQMQLIQAEKLESLGRLAAGVAHEVRNPLAMLQMGVDFYTRRPGPKDENEETMMEMMHDAIARANRIIVEMIDVSKSTQLEIKTDDIVTCVREVLNLTRHNVIKESINVIEKFPESLPKLQFDRSKIEQVLVNLISNAIDASPREATLEISASMGSVGRVIPDKGLRKLKQPRRGDEVVIIEVRDYGQGIPEDKIGKIFDPFFTTKPTGVGTGLGLSVSKTIVELHNGMLTIENAPPCGVRSRIVLPVASG